MIADDSTSNQKQFAARYAQKHHQLGRVLIADWDVHHGNGTQDAFYDDGSVLFFSTHQWPWYPGTGSASETGYADGEGSVGGRQHGPHGLVHLQPTRRSKASG